MITKYEYEYPTSKIMRQENKVVSACNHQHEIRKQIQSNGTEHFKEQCVTCGKLGKNFKKSMLTSDQMSKAPLIDDEMQGQSFAYCYNSFYSNLKELKNNWYKEYLLSTVWMKKRRLVFERAGGTCEACLCEEATQVHHLTYDRIGREALFDLVAVCDSCHYDLHFEPKIGRQYTIAEIRDVL